LLRDDGSVAQRYEEPNMTRRFRVLTAALFAFGVCAGPVAAADGEQTITGLLQRSAHDWNHGNLDAFMRGYEDSPATVYMSRSGVIHGYAAIRAHYATHYGSGQFFGSLGTAARRRLRGRLRPLASHHEERCSSDRQFFVIAAPVGCGLAHHRRLYAVADDGYRTCTAAQS
jgi:hypothetical protein